MKKRRWRNVFFVGEGYKRLVILKVNFKYFL